MASNHEGLQAACHQHLWNEYPQTRGLAHANFNGLPLALEGKLPLGLKLKIMATLKAVGLVKGILDYELYLSGRLYMFDFKVGNDKLSKEQIECGKSVVANGGAFCEIRSLEQFKLEIENILKFGQLTTEE